MSSSPVSSTSGRVTRGKLTPKPSQDIMKQLAGLGKKTYDLINSLSLSNSDNVPETVKKLWLNSTTTWPQILVSKECWTTRPPHISDIIVSTLDLIEAKRTDPAIQFIAYRRGGSDNAMDPRIAVAQLAEPNAANPAAIIGLNLKSFPLGIFEAPLALSEFVEPFDEDQQSLLLTPKFWITDLHLDASDGISAPLGSCVKIWITFPPTENNLALMAKAEGQKEKLARIGKHLEGGLIHHTDSKKALYLPVGTIHAVYTIQGSFLLGIDIATPISSKTYPKLMARGLDDSGTTRFKEVMFDRFLLSVDLGFDNNRTEIALGAWIEGLAFSRKWAAENPEWGRDAVKVVEEYLGKAEAKERKICPCGMEGNYFIKHFKEVHMLKEVGLKKKRSAGSLTTKAAKKRRLRK